MARDRLGELQKTQNQSEVSNGNENRIDIERGAKDESKELRKTFERAEIIGQWIEGIEKNTEEARTHMRRIDDVKFNQKDVQDKIQSFFQNNTSIAHQISNKLKEMEGEVGKISAETAEGRIKSIQYNTLKSRFQEALLASNKELENYRTVQKQILQAQLNAKGRIQVSDEELTALLEEGKDIHVFTENILAETAEAKRVLADVEERHQQLLKIERMLHEVRDLFVQMAILIDTQQELVDRVEYQAQVASEYVGAVDMAGIRRSKKRQLKRKIYWLIFLVIVILILLIILFK